MKNLLLFLVLSLSMIGFAQKSKAKLVPKNVVLTSVDNISAEVISEKIGNRVVLFVKKEGKVIH